MWCRLRLLKQTNIFTPWSKNQEPWRQGLALISSENLSSPWTFLGLSPLKCRMKDLALGCFQVSHSMIDCRLWWLHIHSKVCFLGSVLCPKVRIQQDVRPRGHLLGRVSGPGSPVRWPGGNSPSSQESCLLAQKCCSLRLPFLYPNSTSCWQGSGSPGSHTLLVGM